jgi:hypothetical protein
MSIIEAVARLKQALQAETGISNGLREIVVTEEVRDLLFKKCTPPIQAPDYGIPLTGIEVLNIPIKSLK